MFKTYLELGFTHILDPNGIDHILFLLVLTIPFLINDWKKVFILATAFTIGHSLTLALAALNIVSVNSQFVEIAIAISICMTALLNIWKPIYQSDGVDVKLHYAMALIFGLIHGLGFSNFFKTILGQGNIIKPLFYFNIGVECAQLIIVGFVLILSSFITKIISHKNWSYLISVLVFIWSLKMVWERI